MRTVVDFLRDRETSIHYRAGSGVWAAKILAKYRHYFQPEDILTLSSAHFAIQPDSVFRNLYQVLEKVSKRGDWCVYNWKHAESVTLIEQDKFVLKRFESCFFARYLLLFYSNKTFWLNTSETPFYQEIAEAEKGNLDMIFGLMAKINRGTYCEESDSDSGDDEVSDDEIERVHQQFINSWVKVKSSVALSPTEIADIKKYYSLPHTSENTDLLPEQIIEYYSEFTLKEICEYYNCKAIEIACKSQGIGYDEKFGVLAELDFLFKKHFLIGIDLNKLYTAHDNEEIDGTLRVLKVGFSLASLAAGEINFLLPSDDRARMAIFNFFRIVDEDRLNVFFHIVWSATLAGQSGETLSSVFSCYQKQSLHLQTFKVYIKIFPQNILAHLSPEQKKKLLNFYLILSEHSRQTTTASNNVISASIDEAIFLASANSMEEFVANLKTIYLSHQLPSSHKRTEPDERELPQSSKRRKLN